MVHSKGTTESHKLTSAEQLVPILSGVVTSPFPTVTSCTQNAVLFTNVPNNPLHMNSDICNSSSLLHFNATQLPFTLCEFLNIKPPSLLKWHGEMVQNPTIFCEVFVTDSTTPPFRSKTYSTLRSYPVKIPHCIMVLIRWKCLDPC